jgi:hypothetical protein
VAHQAIGGLLGAGLGEKQQGCEKYKKKEEEIDPVLMSPTAFRTTSRRQIFRVGPHASAFPILLVSGWGLPAESPGQNALPHSGPVQLVAGFGARKFSPPRSGVPGSYFCSVRI